MQTKRVKLWIFAAVTGWVALSLVMSQHMPWYYACPLALLLELALLDRMYL